MIDPGTAKDFDVVQQDDGDVYVHCYPDDTIVIPKDDMLTLLQVVMAAIRADKDSEKQKNAAMICAASLSTFIRRI